jgi:hypothetical protein
MLRRLLLACLFGLLVSLPVRAVSVLPLNLDEIVADAAIVFQGKCIANRTEREANTNFVVTYTTFEVHDVLKGQVGATHVIKQIGGHLPGETMSFHAEGVPSFAIGENYVVFLAGVSSAGFSSPIGLDQGKFNVISGPAGLQVTNGRDFKEMTAGIPAQHVPQAAMMTLQQAPGPVRHLDLDDFKQLVRQRAAGAK